MTPLSCTLTAAFILASGVSTPALAQTNARTPVEIWRCTDLNPFATEVLVTATVDSGRTRGTIAVAGVTYNASFEVEGFNRRWNFGGFRYAFIIDPNGDARYYDFGNEAIGNPAKAKASNVMASNVMDCRQNTTAPQGVGKESDDVIPASPRFVILPPSGAPREVRGRRHEVKFWVTADGRVTRIEVSPQIKDEKYRREFTERMMGSLFNPATTRDGRRVDYIATVTLIP